jgi:hypothetical protein
MVTRSPLAQHTQNATERPTIDMGVHTNQHATEQHNLDQTRRRLGRHGSVAVVMRFHSEPHVREQHGVGGVAAPYEVSEGQT